MIRSIVILATIHEVQGLPGYLFAVEDPIYKTKIECIIRDCQIDFIFEEASGYNPTTANRSAIAILGKASYFDLDVDRDLITDLTPICDLKTLRVAEHLKRERRWIEHVEGEVFERALLICGVGHSLSVASRLTAAGFNVQLCQYLPYDLLCKRAHAN